MHPRDATWPDADLALSSRQHRTARPHPPLGTDSLTAQAVTDAAEAVYESEVVAPLIRVGVAKERREFAWTL